MQDKQQQIVDWLESQQVAYQLMQHPAAYTMEDMRACGMTEQADICKNLFLRDHKGKRHFLVVVYGDKRVDLKVLSERLGSRLSFASAERLEKHLRLTQGEVSPLAVYFDENQAVEVLFDEELRGRQRLGVHPGVNTATVVLPFEELERLVRQRGNPVGFIQI